MTQFGSWVEPRKKKVDRNDENERNAFLRQHKPDARQNENNPRDYDQIKVENGSGYALDPLSILKVEGTSSATWPTRTDDLFVREGMRLGVESKGSQPGDDFDMVTVLQKSAPEDRFAQGVISGPTPVFVYFPTLESLNYPFAIPDRSGNKSRLVASPYGLNRILWHAEKSSSFVECTGETLQSYVNMGEDQQWHWWKLKSNLSCCGSAQADACTECGTVLQSDCPITRTIWAPKGLTLCGCDSSCGQWKSGDVVPAWWFESLGKWVTIPNFNANLEEKEQTVVTSLTMTGGTITPSSYQQVLASFIVNTNLIDLITPTDVSVECTGSISLDDDVEATGTITVGGSIGTTANPVRLEVVSDCDDVTINGGISSTSNIELSGNMSTTATVYVPLSNISLPVSGTCDGTASGPITVSGGVTIAGPLVLTGTLPEAELNGTVTISDTAPVTGVADLTGKKNVTLSGGTAQTFVKTVNYTKPTLTLTSAQSFIIPELSGTISGTLSNATTASVGVSGLTATLDLSSIFEEVDAVDPDTFSFSGCTLTWDTMKVLALKSGASLTGIPVTLSGTIQVPSTVTGTSTHTAQAAHTPFYGVMSWNDGGLTTDDDSVTVPDTATIDANSLTVNGSATINGTYTIEGTAEFESPVTLPGASIQAGSISLSGTASLPVSGTISGTATGTSSTTASGTATVSAPVTVSGPLSISTGVTLTGELTRTCAQYAEGVISGVSLSTDGEVSLPVSGSIKDEKSCTVPVPTRLYLQPDAISPTYVQMPKEFTLSGATISGTTTTIKYVGCKECEEDDA